MYLTTATTTIPPKSNYEHFGFVDRYPRNSNMANTTKVWLFEYLLLLPWFDGFGSFSLAGWIAWLAGLLAKNNHNTNNKQALCGKQNYYNITTTTTGEFIENIGMQSSHFLWYWVSPSSLDASIKTQPTNNNNKDKHNWLQLCYFSVLLVFFF